MRPLLRIITTNPQSSSPPSSIPTLLNLNIDSTSTPVFTPSPISPPGSPSPASFGFTGTARERSTPIGVEMKPPMGRGRARSPLSPRPPDPLFRSRPQGGPNELLLNIDGDGRYLHSRAPQHLNPSQTSTHQSAHPPPTPRLVHHRAEYPHLDPTNTIETQPMRNKIMQITQSEGWHPRPQDTEIGKGGQVKVGGPLGKRYPGVDENGNSKVTSESEVNEAAATAAKIIPPHRLTNKIPNHPDPYRIANPRSHLRITPEPEHQTRTTHHDHHNDQEEYYKRVRVRIDGPKELGRLGTYSGLFCNAKPLSSCRHKQYPGSIYCTLHSCMVLLADGTTCLSACPSGSTVCRTGYHTENNRHRLTRPHLWKNVSLTSRAIPLIDLSPLATYDITRSSSNPRLSGARYAGYGSGGGVGGTHDGYGHGYGGGDRLGSELRLGGTSRQGSTMTCISASGSGSDTLTASGSGTISRSGSGADSTYDLGHRNALGSGYYSSRSNFTSELVLSPTSPIVHLQPPSICARPTRINYMSTKNDINHGGHLGFGAGYGKGSGRASRGRTRAMLGASKSENSIGVDPFGGGQDGKDVKSEGKRLQELQVWDWPHDGRQVKKGDISSASLSTKEQSSRRGSGDTSTSNGGGAKGRSGTRFRVGKHGIEIGGGSR